MPVGVPRATPRRGGPRNATAKPHIPRRPRLDAPSASAETSPSAPSSVSSATASDARDDLPVRVYIEHTDAYQVVYHSNYFKFLWRAREAYVFGGGLASALRHRVPGFDPTAAGWDHLDVVAIDDCVFARSAVLGDDLLVRTSLRGIGETTLEMRQEVSFADTGELAFAATATVAPASATGATTIPSEIRGWRAGDEDGVFPGVVDVGTGHEDPAWLANASASVEDAIPGDAEDDEATYADPPSLGSSTTETRVTLFESELSLGRARGASDADVLRWFERDRTEAIGGSGALSALKENDGVVVVVSSMDGFRCRPGNVVGSAGIGGGGGGGRNVRPAVASVRSTIEMRRRNIQVAFIQRLFDETGACVARAEVTCTCVSRDSGKPTRCPAALAEKFGAMKRG